MVGEPAARGLADRERGLARAQERDAGDEHERHERLEPKAAGGGGSRAVEHLAEKEPVECIASPPGAMGLSGHGSGGTPAAAARGSRGGASRREGVLMVGGGGRGGPCGLTALAEGRQVGDWHLCGLVVAVVLHAERVVTLRARASLLAVVQVRCLASVPGALSLGLSRIRGPAIPLTCRGGRGGAGRGRLRVVLCRLCHDVTSGTGLLSR